MTNEPNETQLLEAVSLMLDQARRITGTVDDRLEKDSDGLSLTWTKSEHHRAEDALTQAEELVRRSRLMLKNLPNN